jgi:hypothetical protein
MSIDYANLPPAPPEGCRGDNGLFLTTALFVETNVDRKYPPRWSLGEVDVEQNGVVYPSARLVYLHSKGEHDAMSKLVGSFKQWTRLKELEWFRKELEAWQAEWLLLQADKAREQLAFHAYKNPSAAKTLFDDANKRGVGRPKKKRHNQTENPEDDASDAARIVNIR